MSVQAYEADCPCGFAASGPGCAGVQAIVAAHTCPPEERPRWWQAVDWGFALAVSPIVLVALAVLVAAALGRP